MFYVIKLMAVSKNPILGRHSPGENKLALVQSSYEIKEKITEVWNDNI